MSSEGTHLIDERFRAIVESAVDCIFIKDDSRRYTYINKAMRNLLGRPESEILGRTPLELFGAEGAVVVDEVDNRTFAGETVNETRSLLVDGKTFYFHTIQSPLTTEEGVTTSIMGVVRDVTALHHAEASLRESKAKNEAILAATPEMMFILTEDGTYADFKTDRNDELAIPPDQIIGKNIRDAGFDENQLQFILDQIRNTIRTGQVHSFEYMLDTPSGIAFFDARMASMGEDQVLATVRNITDKKRAEDELQTVERLKSVGLLAGGIAHDFNNILMGLYGNISLAKDELSSDHPAFTLLTEAERSMGRATSLTQQLLTFARGGAPVREKVRLDELVEGIVSFDLAGSNVKHLLTVAEDLWPAEVDRSQIQQVFSNLMINAVQSMPDGGSVHISLANAEIVDGKIPRLVPGRYVKAVLRDEGMGIEAADLSRVFDPYFTTKEAGSGLGLATAYSIVNRHGGCISVASELGNGACFTLYLPAATDGHLARQSVPEEGPSSEPVPALKILVMDDDPAILKILPRLLEAPGRNVVTVLDGGGAIALCRQAMQEGHPFDLAIMDLTVPGGMGGKDAIRAIREITPGIRAVVSSGYADDPVMGHYANYGFDGVIAKPYTRGKLREVIERVMRR